MSKPRILVGGPARETQSTLFNAYMDGLRAQATGVECTKCGFDLEITHDVVPDPGGPRWVQGKIDRVAKVRQAYLDRAVADGYDGLFLLDSDVMLGPGVLERMWAVDAPVVYGVFWTHSDWGGTLAPWPQVWNVNPYGWTQECADALRAPGVNEVEVLGGGACTLIRGDGFQSHYWPPLMSVRPLPALWSGEDRTYCLGLECRGIRQIAVTGLPIHHCYTLADQTRPALKRIREQLYGPPVQVENDALGRPTYVGDPLNTTYDWPKT